MKKIVRLTESDLTRLVKKIIKEDEESVMNYEEIMNELLDEFYYEIKEKIKEVEKAFEDVATDIDFDDNLDDDKKEELFDMLRNYSYTLEDVKDAVSKF